LPTVQQTPDFTFGNSKPLSREQIAYFEKVMDVHLPEHAYKDLLSEKLHEGYECALGLCQDAKNKVEDFGEGIKMRAEDRWEHVKDAGKELKNNAQDFGEGIKMRAEDRWEHVKDAGKELSNEARNEFAKVEREGERVKESVEEKLHEGYEHAKSVGKELKNKAEDFGEDIKMRAEDRWEHVKDAGKELQGKIEEGNEKLKGKICDGYCDEKIHESKDDMGHEYEDSLKSTWDEIKDVLDKAKDVSKRGYERAIDRSQRDQNGKKIY